MLTAAGILGLMVGAILSLQPQQVRAEHSDIIANSHVHLKCDQSTCEGNEVSVQNDPTGHINCNFNTHRGDKVLPKCNSH